MTMVRLEKVSQKIRLKQTINQQLINKYIHICSDI